MIISMETEGSRIEREMRDECIDWIANQEFEFLTSLNDKDFYQWIKNDVENRYKDYNLLELEAVVNVVKENGYED